MTQKSELGKLGEDIACEYLVNKGYKVIERNFWKPWGELDIVAKYKDGTLVFVEVKTMEKFSSEGLKPEDQLTRAKLRRLQKTASLYAGHRPELIRDNKGWRIDLLTLTLRDASGSTLSESNGLTIREENCIIKHYENI